MKTKELKEIVGQLQEIRKEITRINQAVGETVFNPFATSALDGAIKTLAAKKVG